MATTLPAEPQLVDRRLRPDFDKAAVASLSHGEIHDLDRVSLVAAIRAADLPTLDAEAMAHIRFLEPAALQRILFLARECCRHQGY